MRQVSPAMRVPMTFPYLAIPVGATLMLVKSLALILLPEDAILAKKTRRTYHDGHGRRFVLLLVAGVPIVFALGLAGAVGIWALDLDLITVPTRLFTGMDNFVLLAAPFYILAGEIMNRGGITSQADPSGRPGHARCARRHGLCQCLLFRVSSPASPGRRSPTRRRSARCSSRGCREEGYDKNYAAAVTIASSIIGPIIPPSVIMIIYAAVTRCR